MHPLVLSLLMLAPHARAMTLADYCELWLAKRPPRNTRRGPADPGAHLARAVPALFPDRALPHGPFPMTTDYTRSEQRLVDEALLRLHPDRADRLERLDREVHERLVVMTHVLPDMQAATARHLTEDPSLAGVPRLGLASPHFPIDDPAYLDSTDIVLISDHGEAQRMVTARQIILVGAYDNACLANTMHQYVRAAVEADLRDFVVRIRVRHTCSQINVSLRMVLEELTPFPDHAKKVLEHMWKNFEVMPETIHAVDGRLEFQLLRKGMSNHAPKNPIMDTFRVILE